MVQQLKTIPFLEREKSLNENITLENTSEQFIWSKKSAKHEK